MLEAELRTWVCGKTGLKPEEVGNDISLLSSGRLDSFELLELVNFFEGQTGRSVRPIDINLGNFDTIGKICAFFER
jgi:acyl carrier protein